MNTVEWRKVPCWDDYEVSSDGRVRRVKGGRGDGVRELAIHRHSQGYSMITLCRESSGSHDTWGNYAGNKIKVGVHRLVAAAFLGVCPDGHEVNHIDMNPANNRVENLEYVTHEDNLAKARAIKGNWSEKIRGQAHFMYGKHPTLEVRKKMSHAKRGAKHWRAKHLDPVEIKRLHDGGMNMALIAAQMGVSRTCVGDVLRGTHWTVGGYTTHRKDLKEAQAKVEAA